MSQATTKDKVTPKNEDIISTRGCDAFSYPHFTLRKKKKYSMGTLWMLHFIHMKRSTKFLFFLTASVSLFVLQASFASAKTICIGQPTTFYWSGSNVSSCTATYSSNDCLFTSGSPAGGSITGSKSMSPSATCSATLTCSGGGASASDTDTLTVDTTKTWNGTACVTPAPAAPSFSATCAQQANGTYNITVSWSPVANATNYPLRLVNPTTNVETDIGYGAAGDGAPTASPYTFTGQSGAGTYNGWGHAWNSGGWSEASGFSAICAAPSAPSGTLTASTCTVASGANYCNTTITWSTSNTTFATVWDNVNAAARQGGTTDSFTDSIGYSTTRNYYLRNGSTNTGTLLAQTSVTPVCVSGTSWNGSTCATIVTARPDLIAGTISPTTATVGTSLTLSATITNQGTASTGASFSNFMQVATAANGAGTISNLTAVTMSTLSAGSNSTSQRSHTFSSAGTYSVRACADKSTATDGGTITESNEGNNCGAWTNVTVNEATPPYIDIFFN